MTQPLCLITHSGRFHCDEVTASALMIYCYPHLQTNIIRTRNMDIINNTDDSIVIDVGMVYDHSTKRYDHHQSEFNLKFDYDFASKMNFKSPMSSCGLIWKHYGYLFIDTIISDILADDQNKQQPLYKTNIFDQIDKQYLHNKIYKNFIYQIDCNDNGITFLDGGTNANANANMTLVYKPFELSQMIGCFNQYDDNVQNEAFLRAVNFSKDILVTYVKQQIISAYSYRSNLDSFLESFNSRKHTNILFIDHKYGVSQYLNVFDYKQEVKFVIVQDHNKERNEVIYLMWTVNEKNSQFKTLVPIMPYDEAIKLVNKDDIIFIHKAQFTGSCKNFDTAYTILAKSLELSAEIKNENPFLNSFTFRKHFLSIRNITIVGTAVLACAGAGLRMYYLRR